MSIQERFAGSEGRACIKYFQLGSKIVVGGKDGDIFVFGSADEAADDTDYEPFNVGADEILGLAVANNNVFVAPKIDPVGGNEVLSVLYEGKSGSGQGVITKFTAEATCVDASKDGVFVLGKDFKDVSCLLCYYFHKKKLITEY